jgi:A/G-specific adenine glycosylase
MTEREPVLRVRHAITNTGYYVRVYAPLGPEDVLSGALSAATNDLHWVKTSTLPELPLTGLAKKVLQRLDVMAVRPLRQVDLEAETQAPAKPARGKRAATPASEPIQDDDWF